MRGHTLVQVEDLVGLGAAARSVARQVLKAAPLPLVRGDERVEIHTHTVFAATPGFEVPAGYADRVMSGSTG